MQPTSPYETEVLKWGANPWDHMDVYTTGTTHAKCWTLSKDLAVDETLGPREFSKKLLDIVSMTMAPSSSWQLY
jgi:hypothetical protein